MSTYLSHPGTAPTRIHPYPKQRTLRPAPEQRIDVDPTLKRAVVTGIGPRYIDFLAIGQKQSESLAG